MTEPSSHHFFGKQVAKFALDNAVPMNLLFILLVVVGGIVIGRMPVDVYPDVSLDEATIETIWLGASPQDIERMITSRIEEKIQDIRGIDRIVSDSKPSASFIRVKFIETLSDNELDASLRQLRAAVDQVNDLPEESEKPVVTKISVSEVFYLIWIAIEDDGRVGEEVLHDIAIRLKPILREIPGVAKVDDKLIRDREVHIRVDQNAIRKYDITLQDISEILQQYNRSVPSGTMTESTSELTIRATGDVLEPEELGEVIIRPDVLGGHVRLKDVADIITDFERKTFFARFNQNDCLALGITKTDEADSRLVVERIRERVHQFEKSVPEGVKLTPFDDASDIISSRLNVLSSNLLGGIVLVLLVLWITVGLKNALLAIVGIPFSFCVALISMHVFGVTINAISLIGLVLCTGMIVDDAIVVLENIYRHTENQKANSEKSGLFSAIIAGTSEVFWPVISSSATTVAAFLPLLIMTGVMGEFFSIIPKTVTVVLIASLFECLLVLPVHYLDFGLRKKKATSRPAEKKAIHSKTKPGILVSLFRSLLKQALRRRMLIPLPLIGLAFLTISAVPLIDTELFPSEFQHCLVDIQVADEASLDQTGEMVSALESLILDREDLVSGILTSFGLLITEDNTIKLRNNVAQMHVQLASDSSLGADSTEVAAALNKTIKSYIETNPNTGIKMFRVWAPRSGPPIGKPVSIQVECPEFRQSKTLVEQYKSELSKNSRSKWR